MKAEIGENVGSDLVAYISDLQKQVEEKDKLIAGLVDDFKYYISEQDNEPSRAGFLELAGKEQALK